MPPTYNDKLVELSYTARITIAYDTFILGDDKSCVDIPFKVVQKEGV